MSRWARSTPLWQELENTLLFMHMDVDGVGDVRLSDVADIALTDNAGESYAKVNGNDGVLLSFQKQSTARPRPR